MIVGWICCIILAACGIYLAIIAWNAANHVSNQPRTDMYICDVHGPMPIGATLTVFNGDMEYETESRATRGPVRACPMCFNDKIKKAKEQWGKR